MSVEKAKHAVALGISLVRAHTVLNHLAANLQGTVWKQEAKDFK
jgi:hypothetical protein